MDHRSRIAGKAVTLGVSLLLVGTLIGSARAQEPEEPEEQVDACANAPIVCQQVAVVDGLVLFADSLDDNVTAPDAIGTATNTLDPLMDAQCHPVISYPYKSAKFTVAVDAHAECGSEQEVLGIGVTLYVKKGGVWKKWGKFTSELDTFKDHTKDATSSGACTPDTNRKYRALATAGDQNGRTDTEWGPVAPVGCPTGVEILQNPNPLT